MKKTRFLLPLLCLFFTLISCEKQTVRTKNVVFYEKSGSGEEITLENDFLELRFLPAAAELVLTEKKTGVQWRTNPQDRAEDPLADPVMRQLTASQFSLEYADVSGVGMIMDSSFYSVEQGAYTYTLVDGGLEVRYTVGNLSRTYLFPAAAGEERMVSFLNKIDRDDRRKIEAGYRLYDINNLRANDNRDELLALYPDLSRGKVYVLRDNTQEYMKEQIEGFFAGAGYTYDDYLEDVSRYAATAAGAERPAFNITLRYSLDGNSLVLSVPFDEIAYRPSFPLIRLSLLPFMGAAGINDNGYFLVPDGSGALIYFNNGRQNQIPYNNRVYGWDEAMPRDAVISDNKAPFPAFGIQKNGNALVCVIEEGSAYAGLHSDVSGRNCSYNSVYAWFDMIHGATMDIAGRSDRAVYLYQNGLPANEKIVLRYTPCASGGYVGMAKEYRSRLMHRYPDLGMRMESGVPIAVEIIGAVNKIRHLLGIPFDRPLKLTGYREAEGMINDFAGLGWDKVRIKLSGWFNRSYDHSIPVKIKLIRELGSKKDFQKMVSAAGKNGYELFPRADFLFLKDTKPFDGFNLYRDTARYVNRKRIEKYPYSVVWFGERKQWGKPGYLARPVYTMSLIDNFRQKAARMDMKNIAFESLGARLSGDYNEKRAVSRETSIRMRQEKLAELARDGTGVLLNRGYVYAVPWADIITDMALDDQGFGITDVSVPFYQIVLHGLVPYTGRAINLAEDYTKNLLKTVECGAGLYFSFMAEETAVLRETKYMRFYANEYGKWAGDADALYRKFCADFSGLYSQAIENHEILAPGVTLTEYEDGTGVIVNAGANAWNYRGIVIEADSYIVLRQGGTHVPY